MPDLYKAHFCFLTSVSSCQRVFICLLNNSQHQVLQAIKKPPLNLHQLKWHLEASAPQIQIPTRQKGISNSSLTTSVFIRCGPALGGKLSTAKV